MEEEYNDFCRIGDYFKNKSSKKEEDDGGSFVSVIELRGYGLNVNIGFSCAKCETDFSINIDDCLYSKKRICWLVFALNVKLYMADQFLLKKFGLQNN